MYLKLICTFKNSETKSKRGDAVKKYPKWAVILHVSTWEEEKKPKILYKDIFLDHKEYFLWKN